ncbi:lysine-specific demethylase JMJ31 isoform X2 [Elaeis guineensis]|uniref:lysine-specific demethylase JMJ31 isoform X2 n=1 Tax=Elaeis guineensis var. tenera TaxID=51953 RepID=UPI003C6D958D
MEAEAKEEGRVEQALQVRQFENPPSAEDFSTEIEPTNVPAVFHGAVKDWKAFSKWNPFNGGLDYLEEKAGSAVVEAMHSKSAPVFFGDLRSHERVAIPFSAFIASCKLYLHKVDVVSTSTTVTEESSLEPSYSKEVFSTSDTSDQFYIAQVPILNTESKERCQLEILREDIQMPLFIGMKTLASVNFWMNRTRSRSSNHYDPHHNLLCVVAGSKEVVLWPPSACPFLYPMPIYGEASNHSAVDIENPNLSFHVRAKHSKQYSQTIVLHSGDALFIPEGWFHQVDSDELTIAVNFWWKSNLMSRMLEHMDGYYLRRILSRLVDKEMDQILHNSMVCNFKGRENHAVTHEDSEGIHVFDSNHQREGSKVNRDKHGLLQQLEPHALHLLYELLSLVHDAVKVSGQDQAVDSNYSKDLSVNPRAEYNQITTDSSCLMEHDPVANIFWAVEPLLLQRILLVMVNHFPRTLEALILHMLSPTAAEVLTRKFDEMDQLSTKEQQDEFYQLFYSIFDDQYAAMDSILNGKELFNFQMLRN